jgi:hypothetical protein
MWSQLAQPSYKLPEKLSDGKEVEIGSLSRKHTHTHTHTKDRKENKLKGIVYTGTR